MCQIQWSVQKYSVLCCIVTCKTIITFWLLEETMFKLNTGYGMLHLLKTHPEIFNFLFCEIMCSYQGFQLFSSEKDCGAPNTSNCSCTEFAPSVKALQSWDNLRVHCIIFGFVTYHPWMTQKLFQDINQSVSVRGLLFSDYFNKISPNFVLENNMMQNVEQIFTLISSFFLLILLNA